MPWGRHRGERQWSELHEELGATTKFTSVSGVTFPRRVKHSLCATGGMYFHFLHLVRIELLFNSLCESGS